MFAYKYKNEASFFDEYCEGVGEKILRIFIENRIDEEIVEITWKRVVPTHAEIVRSIKGKLS